MAAKPCKLVILKRFPKDPELQKTYPPEYWAGYNAPSAWAWKKYQSNGSLFNKSDLKRDVMYGIEERTSMQIMIDGEPIETLFEMVELIEKNSFGWIIYQQFPDSGRVYLASILPDYPETDGKYRWLNSRHNAMLFPDDLKTVVLTKLREMWPASKFEAQELFTQ